jgi:hypothetical protein
MPDPTPFPWEGLKIIVLTVVVLFTAIALIVVVVEWIDGLRHALRSRYFGNKRELNLMDLLIFPAWILLEILCLVLQLTFGLVIGLLIYQGAKDARDWWHAGEKGRR